MNRGLLADLPHYVNSGILSRGDLPIALVHPRLPFRRNARTIVDRFDRFCQSSRPAPGPPREVEVAGYEGPDAPVRRMMAYLARQLTNDLLGAYVHGSLGTYEALTYSDFDALVILKNEVFSTPRRLEAAAWKLSRAQSIMLDFDPLQHHGWFVLTEAELSAYPDDAFPVVLFDYAKSLLSERGRRLTLRVQDVPEARHAAFRELSSRIVDSIACGRHPSNMYALKLLLSQFMLLPALYVQARDGRGVYKKFSFDLARADIAPDEWAVMDEVSTLRATWSVMLSPIQRFVLTRTHPTRRAAARWLAPAIPSSVRRLLTPGFYRRMQMLALRMRQRLRAG